MTPRAPIAQARTRIDREARRRSADLRRAIGAEIRTLREDAGVSQAAVARAAGISASELSRIEAGLVAAPVETLVRISVALGADLGIRLTPGAGVPIRDRYQAPMLEGLLRILHTRWKRFLEVPVFRPVRGVVDLVLHDPLEAVAIASEAHSLIRRVEQQLRWHNLKGEGLVGGSQLPLRGASVSQLLLLRDTPANDRLVSTYKETFRTQYPADPRIALSALTSADVPWPGAAMLWAKIDGTAVVIRAHPRRRRLPD